MYMSFSCFFQESIYDKFIERAIERVKAIKVGNPLDPTVMMGAQASTEQLEKIFPIWISANKKARNVL